jgi:hypothetical protein
MTFSLGAFWEANLVPVEAIRLPFRETANRGGWDH